MLVCLRDHCHGGADSVTPHDSVSSDGSAQVAASKGTFVACGQNGSLFTSEKKPILAARMPVIGQVCKEQRGSYD